jgi:hypothetical protein
LDRWKRKMVEVVIRPAKMRFSAISATTVMQMSVNGQCDSENESRRTDGGAGESAGWTEDVSDDNDNLPGSWEWNVRRGVI